MRYHLAMAATVPPHEGPNLQHRKDARAADVRPGSISEARRLRPHQMPHVALSADTDPAAECVQFAIYRTMTPSRKLQLVLEAIDLSRGLALAGLRARHPDAKPDDLRRRLYGLELGEELAAKAFGPIPQDSGEP